MAPQATPGNQPNERPKRGICVACGLGFTPRVPHATLCYPCWRASRTTTAPADERAQRARPTTTRRDGLDQAVLTDDDHDFPLRRNPDGSAPAWRLNLRRAATLRARAARADGPTLACGLRAAAYDAERLARSQRASAWDAAQAASAGWAVAA